MTDGALPDPASLECFLAAARCSSFRAAADSVSLTPAALGKRIKLLETRLGTSLFRRTTRRLEITEAGLALVPAAQRALDGLSGCVRAARGDAGPPPLTLSLGTRHELGLSWLVPALDRLAERLPHVTLELYFGAGPDLEQRVASGALDAAVSSRRIHDPTIGSERLHPERYVFVASPRLLARRPLTRPAQAVQHVLVDAARELPLFAYWRSAPNARDLPFGSVSVLGTTAAIRQRVLEQRGVAVLPEYLVAKDLERRRLAPLFPSVSPASDWFRLIHRLDDPKRATLVRLATELRAIPLV
jgi:LysR family glycine cleavage system transcriptional activator